jgi:hypothetical protein
MNISNISHNIQIFPLLKLNTFSIVIHVFKILLTNISIIQLNKRNNTIQIKNIILIY